MVYFVIGLLFALIVVAEHEYYERKAYMAKLREEAKQGYLKDFYQLLAYYDRELVCDGPAITNTEVKELQVQLDELAARIAVYLPGFTAPRLV